MSQEQAAEFERGFAMGMEAAAMICEDRARRYQKAPHSTSVAQQSAADSCAVYIRRALTRAALAEIHAEEKRLKLT